MPSIFPDSVNGGIVIRDIAGQPTDYDDELVLNALVPGDDFTSSCVLTALPIDCTAKISPAQINAIVSEIVGLAAALTPEGEWDCTALTNLADAFVAWQAANDQIYVVADLTEAAALTGLRSEDIVHVLDNGSTKWVRYQVTAAGDGTWAGVTKVVLWTQDQAPSSHTHTVADLSDASANARTFLQAVDYSGMRTALGVAGLVSNPVWTGAHIWSKNGALSTPTGYFSGTWITGGTATTNKPHFLIEPSGATSTGWSTAGTGLGINAASGFTGNLLDLHLNGSSKFKVDKDGIVTSAAGFRVSANNADIRMRTSSGYGWRVGQTTTGTTPGYFYIQQSNDDWAANFLTGLVITTTGLVGIGGATSSFPALKASGTTMQVRLADDSAYAPLSASAITAFNGAIVYGSARLVPQALTDAANVAWNGAAGAIGKVTLGGNRTFDPVTNLVEGDYYELWITQDATGTRVPSFTTSGAGSFSWGTAGAPTLTTTASKTDILGFRAISIGGTLKLCFQGIVKGH